MIITVANTKHNTRLNLHKVQMPQELSKTHRVLIRDLCPNHKSCCGALHTHPLTFLAVSSDWMYDRHVVVRFERGRPFYINPLTVSYGIDKMFVSFDDAKDWREITSWPVADEVEYTLVVDPLDLIGDVGE